MADKPKQQDAPTNIAGQPANQESSVREAKFPDEKPDPSTVAAVEVIADEK